MLARSSHINTHYSDVIMKSSGSLAFVRGIHRWPVNSPHKGGNNAENVSIWWRHHAGVTFVTYSSMYWNESVVRVTAPVSTGDVKDKLQCFQWIPKLSTWQPVPFSVEIEDIAYQSGHCTKLLYLNRHYGDTVGLNSNIICIYETTCYW